MSILVFILLIGAPLLLVAFAALLTERFEASMRRGNFRERSRREAAHRIRVRRLSLDTRVPSPMLRRIQEEFYPEKVAAEALNEAKRELVEEHDRTACYN